MGLVSVLLEILSTSFVQEGSPLELTCPCKFNYLELRFAGNQSAERIADGLLRDIARLDDPWQDNVSFCVIKVQKQGEPAQPAEDPVLRRKFKARNGSVTILAKVKRSAG